MSRFFSGSELPRKVASIGRRRHVLLQLPLLHPRHERRGLQSHLQQRRIPFLRTTIPCVGGLQGYTFYLS